jgi:hypothetical protein
MPAITSRDPDVVAALRNHYRLAELQSEASVREAQALGAGEMHLSVLREIAANDAMLAEGYLAERDAIRSRAQRGEVMA